MPVSPCLSGGVLCLDIYLKLVLWTLMSASHKLINNRCNIRVKTRNNNAFFQYMALHLRNSPASSDNFDTFFKNILPVIISVYSV